MTSRTEMIKSGEIKLVKVHGVYRGKSTELGEPARYLTLTGEYVFADCSICGRSRRPEAMVEGKVYCRECRALRLRSWRVDNGADSDARKHARRKSRTPEQVLEDRRKLRGGTEKTCRRCGASKTFESFYSDLTEADGLMKVCKSCAAHKLQRRAMAHWAKVGIPLECFYCGNEYVHVDHVYPSSIGGSSDVTNLVPACIACNCSAGAKPKQEWVEKYTEYNWESIKTKFERYGIKWEL